MVLTSRRSFDDAQSRLKSRKLLGMGGQSTSKILQILGTSPEHIPINLPGGFQLWQAFTAGLFFVFSMMCIIFPGVCQHFVGMNDDNAEIVIFRLLGAAFSGIAILTWLTQPLSVNIIRMVLAVQMVYFGLSSLVLAPAVLSGVRFVWLLFTLHVFLVSGSTYFFVAIVNVNKPQPHRPIIVTDNGVEKDL